jgi:ABC-2 type transport system permease protein
VSAFDLTVARAIARKDLRTYLGNPTGYVFLTLFIGTTAAAAFLQEGFFNRNLADLALLNGVMPAILMFFVPAITMGAWSEERRAGTDELLLTLPVRDVEVVVGKYLGALGIFTVSLAFSLAHLFVLASLGSPDPGLMISTYLGHWLVGALFVAVGLLASMFSANATVAFILGALGCAGLVFAGSEPWASGLLGAALIGLGGAMAALVVQGEARGVGTVGAVSAAASLALWLSGAWAGFPGLFDAFAVSARFAAFGEGVIRAGDVLFFAGGVVTLLYLAAFLLGRRTW